VEVLISTLPGSVVHRLCIEMYLQHSDNGAGICARCGYATPCPVRRHTASVIRAAGEDPHWYDARASVLPHRPTDPPARGVEGYSLGGHGRRADVPYFAAVKPAGGRRRSRGWLRYAGREVSGPWTAGSGSF